MVFHGHVPRIHTMLNPNMQDSGGDIELSSSRDGVRSSPVPKLTQENRLLVL